jgi:hypothetical protein
MKFNNIFFINKMYYLFKTTPLQFVSSKDQKALSKAYQEALKSDFKTFKLGAIIRQSKVVV